MLRCLILLMLFTGTVSAKETLFLDGNNPNPLSNYEGMPSSVVGGCVNAITGDYFETSTDLNVLLPESLLIQRSHTSSNTYQDKLEEGTLLYGWNLNHHGVLSTYYHRIDDSKSKFCLVEGFGGMTLRLDLKSKGHFALSNQLFDWGATNAGSGMLSGQTNLRNTVADCHSDGKFYTVHDGSGAAKTYTKPKDHHYRLTEERRPNGNYIHYEYDKDSLKSIVVRDREKQEMASVHFSREKTKKSPKWILTSSDGRQVIYDFRYAHEGINLLNTVKGTEGPAESYEYEKVPKRYMSMWRITKKKSESGYFKEITYHNHRSKEKTAGPRSFRDCRVDKLADSFGDLYLFKYGKDRTTTVTDGIGRCTTYTYDKSERLTETRSTNKIERFVWSDHSTNQGNLLQQLVEDKERGIQLLKRYHYDQRGNVSLEQTYGCLTGTEEKCIRLAADGRVSPDCTEHYDIHREFAPNGFNLVCKENFGRYTKTYAYLHQTNLKTIEYTWENGAIKKRHFWHYHSSGAVASEIIDDGCSENPGSCEGATRRFFTLFENSATGLPTQVTQFVENPITNETAFLGRKVNRYSPQGLLVEQDVYDGNEQYRYTLKWEYDSKGNLTNNTDALGNVTTYQYDVNRKLIQEQGPAHVKYFEYDIGGRLIKENTNGYPITHTYNQMGQKLTTNNGYITKYGYDIEGYLQTVEHPDGSIDTKIHDAVGKVIKTINALGMSIDYQNSARGEPIRTQYQDGSFEANTYTLDGLLKSHKGRDGQTFVYEHDYAGRVIEEKSYDSNGNLHATVVKKYDAFNLIEEVDEKGISTHYHYDLAGRLICTEKADSKTHIAYDALGLVKEKRVGDNIVTSFEYDLNGNLIKESGSIDTYYAYDASGRCISKTIGNATTLTEYDLFGRITSTTDPEGNKTHFLYDMSNNVLTTTTIFPNGIKELQIHDARGRLATLLKRDLDDTLLFREDYVYDKIGNQTAIHTTAITPGEQNRTVTTCFTYNWEGEVTSCIEAAGAPEQKTTSHQYNTIGQKTKTIKPDGTTLAYTYDSLGRLKHLISSDGTITYDYHYDIKGNPTLVQSANGTTLRTYDVHDRLTSETLENALTIHYTYNDAGQITKVLYPDQTSSTYTYENDRLTTISRPSYTHHYTDFDSRGNILGDDRQRFTYDLCDRPLSIESKNWKCHSITYDSLGNRLSLTTKDAKGTVHSRYTYDPLNQLSSEEGVANNQFTNDSIANITSLNDQPRPVNSLNQLLTDTLSYDANGNLITLQGMTLTYDALDRLIEVEKEGTTYKYAYDPWNRRLSKSTGETYLYLGQNEIGCYQEGRCKELRMLGVGFGAEIGASVAIELNGTPFIPIHDPSGNITALLHLDGSLAETYRYTAYGEQILATTLSNPWQFSSKRLDAETGLVNFGRRYYSPALSRWITSDPIGNEDGPNLYAYVSNNPLTHFDEYGLSTNSLSTQSSGSVRSEFWRNFSAGMSHQLHEETFGLAGTNSDDDSRDVGGFSYYAGRGAVFTGALLAPTNWITKPIKLLQYGGKAAFVGGKYLYRGYKGLQATRNIDRGAKTVKHVTEAGKCLIKRNGSVDRAFFEMRDIAFYQKFRKNNDMRQWIKQPTKDHKGYLYISKDNIHNRIRLMLAKRNSPQRGQQCHYAKINKNGKHLDINANIVEDCCEQSHIRIDDFIKSWEN